MYGIACEIASSARYTKGSTGESISNVRMSTWALVGRALRVLRSFFQSLPLRSPSQEGVTHFSNDSSVSLSFLVNGLKPISNFSTFQRLCSTVANDVMLLLIVLPMVV